jgi:hypothetical protein
MRLGGLAIRISGLGCFLYMCSVAGVRLCITQRLISYFLLAPGSTHVLTCQALLLCSFYCETLQVDGVGGFGVYGRCLATSTSVQGLAARLCSLPLLAW